MQNKRIYDINNEIQTKVGALAEISEELESYREDVKTKIEKATTLKERFAIEDQSIKDTHKMSLKRVSIAREIDILKIKRRYLLNELGKEMGIKESEYISESKNLEQDGEIEISMVDETVAIIQEIADGIKDTENKYKQVEEAGL